MVTTTKPSLQTLTKQQVIGPLRRRLRDLTQPKIDHVALAEKRLSYADRDKIEKVAAREAAEHRAEVDALTAAIAFLEDKMPEGIA